jgi:hypothetical protein
MLALKNVISDFCNGAFNLTFTPSSHRAQAQKLQLLSSLPLPRLLTAIERLAPEPLTYHLSRSIITIPDLWREWTMGLGGQLSVEALDKR